MTDPILSLKERLGGRSIYLIGMMGAEKRVLDAPLRKDWGMALLMPML